MTNNIKIHNQDDFESMRMAGSLAADCLDYYYFINLEYQLLRLMSFVIISK